MGFLSVGSLDWGCVIMNSEMLTLIVQILAIAIFIPTVLVILWCFAIGLALAVALSIILLISLVIAILTAIEYTYKGIVNIVYFLVGLGVALYSWFYLTIMNLKSRKK